MSENKNRMSTTELVDIVTSFCEMYSGINFYPYQEQFARRIIRSVLTNDGNEISALFSRQCIPEGELIHTREGGLVKIEDHPDSWVTNESAEVLQISIKGGYTLKCTANHPVMTDRGWLQAGLLKAGDKVATLDSWDKFGDGIIEHSFNRRINVHRTDEVNLRYEINDELAELVGWLSSDGYVNGKGQSIKFTNNNLKYLDRVEYLVTKYFPDIKPKRYKKGNGFDTLLTTGEKSYKNSLKDFMSSMDYEGHFPKAVTKFTRSQVISFLTAMYASDGYVYQRDNKNIEIGLSASNEYLYAQYCRELLNKLGIPSKIKKERMKKNKDGSMFHRVVTLGQRNVLKFGSIFSIPDKPIPTMPYSRVNSVELHDGEDGESLKYSNVISIKKLEGTYRVYDVTYPDKGWFICNGVKVHNSGKSETVSVVSGGMMVILPKLANTPMFAEDPRLQMFQNGLMVGIFAPSQRQAQTTYGKIRSKVESERGLEILSDPEFNLRFTTSNGTTVALSNGSFVTAISASDGSNIEGESFHVIICEECLPKGTPISTPYGLKNVEDVIEGDLVLSYNHNLDVIEPKVVERSFHQPLYDRRMVNIHLSNGEILKCTDNHKIFLTNRGGYFRADLASVGDSMLSCINTAQEEVFITKVEIEDPKDTVVYDLTVEGNHNFFANSVLVHNCQDISDFKLKKSIHPMGAAYNASIIKIGTASTRKGDFYNVIQRNKKEFEDGVIRIRNHFEYDHKVVSKYNEKYRKYIEQEKRRLGEKSDEFQLSYALTWILQRGMFIDIDEFEARNVDPNYDIVPYDKSATHVVGIDVGGASDSTVITVCEVDWTMPVVMESRTDEETGEEIVYQCYNTYVKAWHEIKDTPNFEEQYVEIMHFLSNFKIARIVIDATKESALADRINANTSYEVVSYVFSSKSKSDLYKTFEREVNSGRVHVPGGEETKQSPEYLKCLAQLQDLEKSWRGAYMVVSHPPTKDGRDDFPDSLALAIWGCMDRGEVSDIRGSDRRAFINPNAKLFKERNQYTARRRR